ncbi:cytochrome d ubiquinol oxidase subunit II [Kribbella amoyensis]|uniref:cytochrome d ubiquinol oxidase subunit II n=1 Tax=Kribbella amoyensis TaxID=996641 RepID=UPI00119CB53E|nr:cytochrome d ubiquinol oxidase subunit II [Kribbella amoyensis]
MINAEMARRHRQVQLVVGLVYVGLPLAFLGLVLWMASTAGSAAWLGAVIPVAMLAAGLVLRRRHRYQPQLWGVVGALFGAIAGLVLTLFPVALGVYWLAFLFLPGMWLGMVIGVALARYAERVLLVPLEPGLADTPYELGFRLRGVRLTTLTLGKSTVSIKGQPVLRAARSGLTSDDLGRTYPLSKVTGVFEVELSGAERLKFPISLPYAPIGTAGPAVILQASGQDWVLPTDQAATLAEMLNRRIAAGTT